MYLLDNFIRGRIQSNTFYNFKFDNHTYFGLFAKKNSMTPTTLFSCHYKI